MISARHLSLNFSLENFNKYITVVQVTHSEVLARGPQQNDMAENERKKNQTNQEHVHINDSDTFGAYTCIVECPLNVFLNLMMRLTYTMWWDAVSGGAMHENEDRGEMKWRKGLEHSWERERKEENYLTITLSKTCLHLYMRLTKLLRLGWKACQVLSDFYNEQKQRLLVLYRMQ